MSAPAAAEHNHPEQIKATIRIQFGSIEALAELAAIPAATLRACLRRPVPAGNRVIAKHLGKTVHELWPEWFDRYGNRTSSSALMTRHASAGRSKSTSQKGAHA